ncbi:aminoglycoside phosphotransferase family protein [Dactylosporangium sp. CA-052675]|uniref:aminoglycoside phosphotransferase family protein n=1 Tax=Dactylosporangium sp. CA-052675 TaxID=3239927 RepID=UPI003D8B49F3
MSRAVDVPEVVRRKAVAAGARDWLAGLPGLLAALEREWGLRLGPVYQGGTEALVVAADLADGTAAVLKLLVPRPGDHARHEATVLRLAGGDGCARLLRGDEGRGALLIERLGPALSDLAVPLPRRLDILTEAAARVWRPAPGADLPTGRWKAGWLAACITAAWERTGRPCPERTVAHALACCERRGAAHDDERAVLVHGDVHQWNALRAPGGGFRLVDPDGLLADAEYDLGILMREDPEDLLTAADPRARARRLARRTGRDEVAIWEWGNAERVSTGLLLTEIGLQPVARDMLAAANRIAAEFT